eukprot:TRINITY_DN568_c0_g1_i1.p1 TRINITY_DN568_c0_g1~~TRINITY_DN568_c0_g1_i1.p1  ORF type:complete len:435 (+),score=76.36 TRINITY_DN568_c0_g1_i1:68-1372(+)
MSMKNMINSKKKKKEDDSPTHLQRRSITNIGRNFFGLRPLRKSPKESENETTVYIDADSDSFMCTLDDHELEQILKLNDSSLPPLIKEGSEGFTIEAAHTSNKDRYRIPGFLDAIYEDPYYCNFFYQKEHDNFIADDETGLGPIIISIENHPEKDDNYKAIVRTKEGEFRVAIHGNKQRKKQVLQVTQLRPNNNALKFRLVKDPKLEKELSNLELQQIEFFTNYKFGVLYCKSGQTENEMFSNIEASKDFDEFLDFLGDRIDLVGWDKFRGGLDVKTNTTGNKSVYTKFHNCNIMFHVSTLLPFSTVDEQQVERKRHIGNDVILIVFKEGDSPFIPKVITSNFNNIIVLVSKMNSENGEVFYRISFAEKHGEGSAQPYLPEIPIFQQGELFREYFLTKLINSERVAMKSREFRNRLRKARLDQLKLLTNQFKDS